MCAIERESKIAKARLECITDRLLLLLVTILAEALLTLVRCNLMSFTFFTAWHCEVYFISFYSKPPLPGPQDLVPASGWRLLTLIA
jgi:hypothetical protein